MTTTQPTGPLSDPAARPTSAARSLLVPENPARQAFLLLRNGFTVAPIAFGLDKFGNLLTDWPQYLAPAIDRLVPGTAQQAMYAVGVIEILAGLLVAWRPRWGAPVVAGWLAGIILDLVLVPGYYDVALRDFGLMIGALALWSLSSVGRLPRR